MIFALERSQDSRTSPEIKECSIILTEDANMLAHEIQDLLDDEPFFDRELL